MKRIISYSLNLLVVSVMLVSCGKTTRGKLTNAWKVITYDMDNLSEYNDGSKSSFSSSMTETTFKNIDSHTSSNGSSYSNTISGTVNSHQLEIKKDGTWSWSRDLYYESNGGATKVTSVWDRSGTWSFTGKNKEDGFKKNERVIFQVLKQSVSGTTNQAGVITSNSSSQTYLNGENVLIFTVKESKRNQLQLESESLHVHSDTGGNASTVSNIHVTLKAE